MLLSRLANVRPEEDARVFRMFVLLALIIATSYVLKPVRGALFLSQFGSSFLPYAYILVALVLGVVAAVFARLGTRRNLPRLFIGASCFLASNLVLFWTAAVFGWPGTGFLFYVWVSIETALLPSLFWLLANYVFYANEGRRLFPVVMAGGLLGSIFGGAATAALVPVVGTAGLLLVAAALLLAVALLVRHTADRERERMAERRSDLVRQERSRAFSGEDKPLRLLARSPLLAKIAALVGIGSLISTLIDYQFNSVVEASFETRDELTRFFGGFFAFINVSAFAFQLFLTGRLLSGLGVGAGLLVLPGALVVSSLAFLLRPSLVTAALMETADDGLSNSVNRASVEVLYLPIALSLKNRLKAWIDTFVERLSRGVGGLLILGASAVSLDANDLGPVIIALLGFWILLVVTLRRDYVGALRDSIARRDITDLATALGDPASLEVFRHHLAGADAKEAVYSLELLHGTGDPAILEAAERLASHESPAVRVAALSVLRSAPVPKELTDMEARARDPDPGAAAEALALWLRVDASRARVAFESLARSGDADRIAAVLDRFEGTAGILPEPVLEEMVERNAESDSARHRRLAAQAIGFLPSGSGVQDRRLAALLADADLDVARSAARSVGKLRLRQAVPALVAALARTPLRPQVRRALARIGPGVVAELEYRLAEESLPRRIRAALPRALAEFEEQSAVDALLRSVPAGDPRVHYQVVKSLARLRSRVPSLRFARTEVDRLLEHESRTLTELARLLASIQDSHPSSGGHRLLLEVLHERIEFTRERIFRLLGLVYDQSEIASLWNRIATGRPPMRAEALEYLSNLLSRRHRAALIPLIEAEGPKGGIPTLEEGLSRLVGSTDYWLAACAALAIGELRVTSLASELERRRAHAVTIVREAAARGLEKLAL
jgi:ATP/ADP translocase/HEAT repeat protein